jgi:DUF1680 family protein
MKTRQICWLRRRSDFLVSHFAWFLLVISSVGGRAFAAGPLRAVPFQKVHVDDSFWSPRIETNSMATIEANLHECEITGRIRNFAVAGKLVEGRHEGQLYNDSDVYKVLEGIAYALSSRADAKLQARADAVIEQIAAAQQPDGYLNTYFTLVKPLERWKNIESGHELYCAGHLIEAAVAYRQATGDRRLLDVAVRFADHIARTFGPDRKHDACGHEEIELALVKLARATDKPRYLELAKFFLDIRGRTDGRRLFGEYAQDHKPVREQTEVTGHAVRAMYLYSAMADMAAQTGDAGLLGALESIWHDVVERKMYVTGGIGPSAHNEGFTVPYDLPNDSAYAETCAAIGMALWNHRMFLMTGEGRFADVLEREVYNGLLSGVSLSGDRFFYVNPLGSKGNHHRVPWFDCSCCPSNIVRYIPGMGERAYAVGGNAIWTVLYMGGAADIELESGSVPVIQTTRYPWDGVVTIRFTNPRAIEFDLNLRIPGWCRESPMLKLNGEPIDMPPVESGYARLSRQWTCGDVVELELPMHAERVYADEHVKADIGRVAIERGPVIYCVEGCDNDGHARDLFLPKNSKLQAAFEPDLLGGVTVVRGEAMAVGRDDEGKLASEPLQFQAIPYCVWDNRAPGPMMVWLPETPELAEIAGDDGIVLDGVRIRASHCFDNDTVAALADSLLPQSSGDHALPRMTWWDHRGTSEWVSCQFPKSRQVAVSSVYWFDDTGRGQCRLPAEWKLLWLDGADWKPVKLVSGSKYATEPDCFNQVEFEPVVTPALRLEVKLQGEFSGGILEWRVDAEER